jgi:hypothetical protein
MSYKSFDPFTGEYTDAINAGRPRHRDGPALISEDADEDQVIERLIEMLTRKRGSERGERRDTTRRRMFAVDPNKARGVERNVRREERKDRAARGMPGNVVRKWQRAGTAKPPPTTFREAGIDEDQASLDRQEGNKGRIQRLLGQKEAKLSRGTHGTYSLPGPAVDNWDPGDRPELAIGGGEMTAQEEMKLQERIRKLKELLGQPA